MTAIDLGEAIAIDVHGAIGWGSAVAINFCSVNLRYLDVLLADELDVAMVIILKVAMSTSLNVLM